MSALSVLSSFVPAAPGGTTPAPAEASANDDLFTGLLAALTSGSGKEADATSDGTPASDTGDVQGSDAVAPTSPWPPVPLIAAAPVVVEAVTAGASESAGTAPAPSPAAHPNSPAPEFAPLPAEGAAVSAAPHASPPQVAPAAKPIVQPGQNAPTIEPAPQPLAQSEAVARPAPPAAPASAAPASEAPTPGSSPVVEASPLVPRQAASPVRAPTADAPPAAPTAAAAGDDAPVPQGDESVVGPTPTAPQVVRTAATTVASAPSTAAASTIAPREPATPAKARPEAPATVVSPPSSGEAPPIETTLRPALAPASRPPILASSPPPTAPVVVIDAAPEQAALPIPADGDSEAAPAKGQQAAATPPAPPASTSAAPTPPAPAAPATPPPPAAPPRNGSARLDERPSNAASTDVPAETGVSGARPAASTATAQNSGAPAPVVSDPTGGQTVAPLETALVDAPAALETPLPHQASDLQDAAPTPARDLGLSQLSRATVETTAQIAAQILRKLDGRSTRFDMALTPEGLGRVDVSMEIDSEGRLSARLAFDNPAAATDLRSRADELRRQLQDAGFQLTQDSLEFSERNSSGFGGGGAFDRAPGRRAFAGAARLAAQADVATPPPGPWASLSLTPDRVDMKV